MTDSLPEISYLKQLLVKLPDVIGPTNAKRAAAPIIAAEYAALSGAQDQFAGLSGLLGSIERLPNIITEQFDQDGRKQAAIAIVERIRNVFCPKNLALPAETFMSSTSLDQGIILSMLPLLEDIQFDSAALTAKTQDIFEEITAFRDKVGKVEGLSHASRVVIDAQMLAMERSLVRFTETGVGTFRESIFSSVGRIVVELQTNKNNEKLAIRETMDDVLRIYGLFEVGGNLLTLAAPVAVKLLTNG